MIMAVGSGIWRIGILITLRCFNHYRLPLIRAFNLESEHFQQLPLPPCSSDLIRSSFFLGVLKDRLSITIRSIDSISAWVIDENDVKLWWTKGLVRVEDLEVDGLPCAVDTACLHVPSFVSLKDVMRG